MIIFLKLEPRMDPLFLLQVLLGGTLLGGIYGLLALGMSLNLGLLNLINLAHGSILLLGGVIGYLLVGKIGLAPIPILFLVPLLFAGLGGISYPLLIHPLTKQRHATAFIAFLIITLGLAFLLEEVTATILTHPLVGLDIGLSPWRWMGLFISPISILLFWVLIGCMCILGAFLFGTKWGWSLLAIPQDPEGAALVGIPLPVAQALAWSLGLCSAGLAGTFWIFLYPITPFMGLKLTVTSLLMIMVVGPGDVLKAVGAGWIWGLLESGGSALLGPQWGILIPLVLFLGWASLFAQGKSL